MQFCSVYLPVPNRRHPVSMKRILSSFVLLLAFAMPFSLKAQTVDSTAYDFGFRMSIGVNKIIMKGLHVTLNEKVWISEFGHNRFQTTLGVNYKVHNNVKIGAGYAFISAYNANANAYNHFRHRFMVDVKGTLIWGDWNFSLKERLQLTHRSGNYNRYQNPANALMLKSCLTLKYMDFDYFEPYLSLELHYRLNAAAIEAEFDGEYYYTLDTHEREGEPGWFLKGFNKSYPSCARVALGGDIKINKRNTINLYLMEEFNLVRKIDANAEGTILKSYSYWLEFASWLGVGYEFYF